MSPIIGVHVQINGNMNISSCCIYSESEEHMALKLYTWLNFFMEISFYPVFKEKPYNSLDILMKFTEDLLHVLNMNHWKGIIDFMGKMEDFVTFEKVWIHLEKSSFRKRLEALCTSVEKKRLNIHNIQLEQYCTASWYIDVRHDNFCQALSISNFRIILHYI